MDVISDVIRERFWLWVFILVVVVLLIVFIIVYCCMFKLEVRLKDECGLDSILYVFY